MVAYGGAPIVEQVLLYISLLYFFQKSMFLVFIYLFVFVVMLSLSRRRFKITNNVLILSCLFLCFASKKG